MSTATLPTLRELVDRTVTLIGAAPPAMLDENAVTLRAAAERSFYLVGLIGGKDVGKSALVNALVGQEIATVIGYGEGTARVTAYAHRSVAAALEAQLQRDVPGQFSIVPHDQSQLTRQVLLDLPDIDSKYESHIALTRRMLRDLLYPIWVQSVEKYADLRPQQMLAEVAAGNSPENFLFCLSKADQLRGANDASELASDFAKRIARTVSPAASTGAMQPSVFVVSARQPDQFDLPRLRETLSRERSTSTVKQSLARAGEQQQATLRRWLADQNLGERAARAQRLVEDVKQSLHDRLAEPLAVAISSIADDPIQLAGISNDCFAKRVDRWPIIRLLDGVLSPAVLLAETLVRGRSVAAAVAQDRASQIEPTLRPLASQLQASMAHLRRATPAIAAAYENDKLWDDAAADAAVTRLRDRLAGAVVAQRATLMQKLSRGTPGAGLVRWLATIGAALWFPLIQPVLALMLPASATDAVVWSTVGVARLVVSLLSGAKLLQDAGFLLIWYVALWLLIRYRARRQVARWLGKDGSAAIELTTIALAWTDELAEPAAVRSRELQLLVAALA